MDTNLIDRPNADSDRLLTISDAKAQVGLSRSKIYQLIAAGKFPRPAKVGARACFSAIEIQGWIADRLRDREIPRR